MGKLADKKNPPKLYMPKLACQIKLNQLIIKSFGLAYIYIYPLNLNQCRCSWQQEPPVAIEAVLAAEAKYETSSPCQRMVFRSHYIRLYLYVKMVPRNEANLHVSNQILQLLSWQKPPLNGVAERAAARRSRWSSNSQRPIA